MKDTTTNNRRIANYIVTIFATILLIAGIGIFYYDYQLEQKAISVYATITSIEYKNNQPQATVKYYVDNEGYTQIISINPLDNLAVNDKIKIKYDMYNHGNLINNEHTIIVVALIILSILIYLVSLPKTLKNIKRSNNIKKLKTKGLFIYANISEVYMNNKGKKAKGKYPYRLRCKFYNPNDSKEYIFDSEDSYLDFQAILKQYNNKTVTVFLDKKNNLNYYVDLDSLLPQINLVDVNSVMKTTPTTETPKVVETPVAEQPTTENTPNTQ